MDKVEAALANKAFEMRECEKEWATGEQKMRYSYIYGYIN